MNYSKRSIILLLVCLFFINSSHAEILISSTSLEDMKYYKKLAKTDCVKKSFIALGLSMHLWGVADSDIFRTMSAISLIAIPLQIRRYNNIDSQEKVYLDFGTYDIFMSALGMFAFSMPYIYDSYKNESEANKRLINTGCIIGLSACTYSFVDILKRKKSPHFSGISLSTGFYYDSVNLKYIHRF